MVIALGIISFLRYVSQDLDGGPTHTKGDSMWPLLDGPLEILACEHQGVSAIFKDTGDANLYLSEANL